MADDVVRSTVKYDSKGQPITDAQEPAEAASKALPRFLRQREDRTIHLMWPIEFDGHEYHELTFHRLTGKDFAKVQKAQKSGASSDDMMLVSVMTNTPVPVLDALDAEDFMEVMKVLQDFLPTAMLAASKKKMEELVGEESSPKSSALDGGESNSSAGPNTPPS